MHITTITPTYDFLIADLSGSDYDKLIITNHYDSQIGGIEHHMSEEFTGLILIDHMSKIGAKNSERFLSGHVIKGKLEVESLTYVMLNRNDQLRVLSNRTLVHHCPNSLNTRVLTTIQQKMLHKGFSI
ncbi:hypothetical protein [Paenibacillus sp. FSL R7-0026]|uniref:hypothetical protein n=1 Tax=Paenibacillus sp. FSL R7-0026 TaxID=2921668 RepID=UPI0030FBA2C2